MTWQSSCMQVIGYTLLPSLINRSKRQVQFKVFQSMGTELSNCNILRLYLILCNLDIGYFEAQLVKDLFQFRLSSFQINVQLIKFLKWIQAYSWTQKRSKVHSVVNNNKCVSHQANQALNLQTRLRETPYICDVFHDARKKHGR